MNGERPEFFDALETRSADARLAALASALPAQVCAALAVPAMAQRLGAIDPSRVTTRAALAALPVMRKSELLDAQIRPYLQGDGGDLYVVGLSGNKLSVHYQGACGTCPSSISGTLIGITNLVRTIEPEIEVEAV